MLNYSILNYKSFWICMNSHKRAQGDKGLKWHINTSRDVIENETTLIKWLGGLSSALRISNGLVNICEHMGQMIGKFPSSAKPQLAQKICPQTVIQACSVLLERSWLQADTLHLSTKQCTQTFWSSWVMLFRTCITFRFQTDTRRIFMEAFFLAFHRRRTPCANTCYDMLNSKSLVFKNLLMK